MIYIYTIPPPLSKNKKIKQAKDPPPPLLSSGSNMKEKMSERRRAKKAVNIPHFLHLRAVGLFLGERGGGGGSPSLAFVSLKKKTESL